jgi:hypothetical protein
VVVNGQFTSAKTDQGHWNFQVSQLQENISKNLFNYFEVKNIWIIFAAALGA